MTGSPLRRFESPSLKYDVERIVWKDPCFRLSLSSFGSTDSAIGPPCIPPLRTLRPLRSAKVFFDLASSLRVEPTVKCGDVLQFPSPFPGRSFLAFPLLILRENEGRFLRAVSPFFFLLVKGTFQISGYSPGSQPFPMPLHFYPANSALHLNHR